MSDSLGLFIAVMPGHNLSAPASSESGAPKYTANRAAEPPISNRVARGNRPSAAGDLR